MIKVKNAIKFGNGRIIIQLRYKDIEAYYKTNETIYKGFYISKKITESELFLFVSNINKKNY